MKKAELKIEDDCGVLLVIEKTPTDVYLHIVPDQAFHMTNEILHQVHAFAYMTPPEHEF